VFYYFIGLLLFTSLTFFQPSFLLAADSLSVDTNFEGASATGIEIDQTARRISFMPGGDPDRGWPCWWYLRINGITPGETIWNYKNCNTDGYKAVGKLRG